MLKAYGLYVNGNYELAFDSAQAAIRDTLNPLYCSYSLLSAYSLAKIPNADDSSQYTFNSAVKGSRG